MQTLNLKTNSAAVNAYYKELNNLSQLMLLHEGAVSPAFAALLRACGSQVGWTLAEQYSLRVNDFLTRSGITNDPNRQDDPQYIVRLIGQIITVSLATVQIVAKLAEEPFRPVA